jgi:hypothetical protein
MPLSLRSGLRGFPRRTRLLGRKLEKVPLLEFDSPSEFYRGAPPDRLSPFFRRLAPVVRVRLSWGSSSLRRLRSGCPVLPLSAEPTAGDEGCQPLAGSALGLLPAPRRFQPRRRSLRPELPRTRASTPLRPVASRPCSMPQTPLGFSLQSLPLSRSRAASRRPSAPLRVRPRPRSSGAKTSGISRPLSSGIRPRCRAPRPPHDLRREEGYGIATTGSGPGFPAIVRPSVLRSCLRRPRRPPETFGLAGARPLRPLRSLSPLENPFPRRTARSKGLAPQLTNGHRAVALLGFASLEPSPPRPRVRIDRENAPRASGPRAPPEDHAPLRTAERGASILRPRPSGPGGGARMAIRTLRRRTLRASAPPFGGAPASPVLSPSLTAFAARPGWTSED